MATKPVASNFDVRSSSDLPHQKSRFGETPVFYSTKTYTHATGLSCAFRQWRATSHCRFLHGYALEIKLVFQAQELDERNWVMDFGGLKEIKEWLEFMFDHTTLVAEDDPSFMVFRDLHDRGLLNMRRVPATGCEAFAQLIFNHTQQWLFSTEAQTHCQLFSVEVREHAGNSAIYQINQ